jgi:hypothetical protein
MLQVDEIPSWLEGTKNCFTDGALYQTISNAEENFTIWSSPEERDSATGDIVPGRDIFAFIALSERLDAEIALDAHRNRHSASA